MHISIPFSSQTETDLLRPECRAAAEQVLHVFIEHAIKHGWGASEASMALADAADDMILLLSKNMTSRH